MKMVSVKELGRRAEKAEEDAQAQPDASTSSNDKCH